MPKHPTLRRLAPALATAALTACAANWYAVPENRPTAGLRVIAENSGGYHVWTRDTTKVCSRDSPNFPTRGGDSRPDPVRAGVPGVFLERGDRFERRIEAETPIRLGISSIAVGREIWTCNVLATFVLKANANYELRYRMTHGECRVGLAEVLDVNGTLTSVPVALKLQPRKDVCDT